MSESHEKEITIIVNGRPKKVPNRHISLEDVIALGKTQRTPNQERSVLILDDSTTWPDRIKDLVNQDEVIELFRKNNCMDKLARHPIFLPILREIEEQIATMPLAAYHCTKQLPERPLSATGLRVLDIARQHKEVRDIFRNHKDVSPSLFEKFDAGLADSRKEYSGSREKMLWLCVDRNLVFGHGTKSFFKYFGGEAVYRLFKNDPEVGPLLERIGDPVVVEVRIRSGDLTVDFVHPIPGLAFAVTLASHFASTVNPEFSIEWREGYLSKGVEPEAIICVHPYSQFARKFGPKHKP